MTDAKHRAQEAAGEVWWMGEWQRFQSSERDAIVAWLRAYADNQITDDAGGALGIAADSIENGEHLKGDAA